jgi:uncharacterized repeat protein (TIGR01451 family)/LPXTG-motif cell wall-anchored protein
MLRRVWWLIGGLMLAIWMVVAPLPSGAAPNAIPHFDLTGTPATPLPPTATPIPGRPTLTPTPGQPTATVPGGPTDTPTSPPGGPTATPKKPPPNDNNTPTATPTITPTATMPPPGDPRVDKSADPSSGFPGDKVTFTIRVRNNSSIPATNVEVNDSVPSAFEITGATTSQGTIDVSGQHVHAVIGTIPPGGEVTIRISTRIRADATPGQVDNVAVLTTDTPGDDPSNNTSSATVTILGPPGPPAARLPRTGGAASWPWATALLALAALLGGLLLRGRRRAS